MKPASVAPDTSTVSTENGAHRRRKASEAHGIHFRCTGAGERVPRRKPAVMVGGEACSEQIAPALKRPSVARSCTWAPAGSGQATKAVNQIMRAGINQAVTEALASRQHQAWTWTRWSTWSAVAPPATGSSNTATQHDQRHVRTRLRVALHHKDLKICQTMLPPTHAQLPMVEMTLVHYERPMEQGTATKTSRRLYRIKRPLFGEDVLTAPGDDDLNPRQSEAVRHLDGPLLVLAGASFGQDRVIRRRSRADRSRRHRGAPYHRG